MVPIIQAEADNAKPALNGAAASSIMAQDIAAPEIISSDITSPDITSPWVELLGATIESEILPRLLCAHRDGTGVTELGLLPDHAINQAGIAAFVDLIIADELDQARAVADRVIMHYGGRDALLKNLLTPAARLLGQMWNRDEADFMTVTLGVYQLDHIMKETATAGHGFGVLNGQDNRILLLPAPGEQHSFGLAMVADKFREGGWCVRSGPAATKAQLLRLVKDEWFDMIGLSVSSARTMKGLPATIRALRAASRNPGIHVLLGGQAVMEDMERARFLGADATASDAQSALVQANHYIEITVKENMKASVTERLHQSKTRLVDIG